MFAEKHPFRLDRSRCPLETVSRPSNRRVSFRGRFAFRRCAAASCKNVALYRRKQSASLRVSDTTVRRHNIRAGKKRNETRTTGTHGVTRRGDAYGTIDAVRALRVNAAKNPEDSRLSTDLQLITRIKTAALWKPRTRIEGCLRGSTIMVGQAITTRACMDTHVTCF